ncbi:MAG: hypothetical protein IOC86_15775, partial [Aestuariivirga sp.]|nr:hypothetical protein [Aestuariivirga sp.]
MTREALAGLLWAEHGEEQARSSLRQALAVLRKELKGQDSSFFAATDAAFALHPEHVEIDTEALLAGARGATRQSLEAAMDLWRGPFLADVKAGEPEIEQWLRERREYFTGKYIGVMDRLVPLLEGQRRIEVAKQLVQADTLREASHRHLMEAYLAAGERPLALRHYESLRKLLKEELGVEPSSETQALRERIVASRVGAVDVNAPPQATPAAMEPTSISQPATAASVSGRRRPLVLALAALVLIGAAAAASWFLTRPPPALAGPPSVAVLPFQSLSGDAGDGRLAEGLTIDTITDLSRFQDFRVIAKDTTDAYKEKAVDIRELGEDLKVSHVLKGTFQRENDHIRVTAQLIDAATGETLWSDRYDRAIGEIFAIQSDVADHIANSLGGREGKVSASMLAKARRKPPGDLGAYETYLLAQETMYSDLSDESMKKAQKILDEVIARDPTFARAYVRYANAFAWRFTYEGGAADLMQQMVNYARKAVTLDPVDADAHAALGYSLTLTGDPKRGEFHLDEALRLTPNAFDVLIFHACLSHAYGKVERGAEAAERAIAINPSFPNWAVPCLRLGFVLVGRHDDAVRIQLRQPEEQWNSDGFVVMAGSLAALGRKDEAAALARRGIERYPGLLSIERFALNRGWPPYASKVMVDLMRRAGFP